jgi:hypothetical protein
MNDLSIGRVIEHNSMRYQILSIKDNLVIACSYNGSFGVESTVYIERSSGKVIATKSKQRQNQE